MWNTEERQNAPSLLCNSKTTKMDFVILNLPKQRTGSNPRKKKEKTMIDLFFEIGDSQDNNANVDAEINGTISSQR